MAYHPQIAADGKVLRAIGKALSTSYDADPITELRIGNWNQLVLLCDLVKDAGTTTVEIKVQVASPNAAPSNGALAPVAADWFDLCLNGTPSIAAGIANVPINTTVYQMSVTGKIAIPIPVCYKFVRVLAKTTGAAGTSTLVVTATYGMA